MIGMRIAKVSAVHKETGMVSVIYPDQEDAATDYLPFFSCGEEYHPPAVDDVVLVAKLSDGIHSAVVLGGFWNRDHKPPNRKAEWSKELTDTAGMSVDNGVLTIRAKDIKFETWDRTIFLSELKSGDLNG